MGGAQSREGLELSDSDEEQYLSDDQEEGVDESFQQPPKPHNPSSSSSSGLGLEQVGSRLGSLNLGETLKNPVRLYLHVGGTTAQAKWTLSQKLASYSFTRGRSDDDEDENAPWLLTIGSQIRARVSPDLQLKLLADQRRVDFVSDGVWALKFPTHDDYRRFVSRFHDCLFENAYSLKPTEQNKLKVYGKDFLSWVQPEVADDAMWDRPDEDEPGVHVTPTPERDLLEEFEEAANTGIQSLALGALDNSFLVGNDAVQVVRNFKHGIHGKGVTVKFDHRKGSGGGGVSAVTPKKGLLMRGETNMMLMSPLKDGKPHSTGLQQLDIETGKIVTEWKFEKDGADITMRDITSDSKGSQLDPSESTFLGLDDNRLCQWDMRHRAGIVQSLACSNSGSPVLHWTQGHQFSRGTDFQCFATTGDGSIVVGSIDGKIRLYSKTSMRQAKTAFPGLGSPITHVDVTYDGKWILGTTATYLILICTLFIDKDGKTKTGFGGRMGNKTPAPRLLKLTPVDSHMAGANNKFHGGQFSWVTENGKQERHIVASVGKYSIIWNFQQVKNSAHECYRNQQGLKSCYCYKILLKDESIVDSRFMHDKFAAGDSPEAPLVVATPMKVSSFSMSLKQ